jgi:hypothetical protein
MSRYLLMLGCSQKKDPSPSSLKALHRYQGVNFRVLKKFLAERAFPRTLDICIISAQYGLLHPDDLIEDYDVRMTPQRARELHPRVMDGLQNLLSEKSYGELFVNMGKDYLPAIEGLENLVSCPVIYAPGRIGEKMSAMKQWLFHVARQVEDQSSLDIYQSDFSYKKYD